MKPCGFLRRTPGQPPIGHTKNFVIYDESDQQAVVKGVMKRLGLDDKQLTPRTVLGRISWAKNHMLDPQELYLQSADPKTEKIAHLYEEYRKELRKANALDFDDLLLEAVRLLKSAPQVREYYNRRFQYLLIDEYQDTNRPQYELMRMLAGERHNVCAVGDEDQSIYSWRGADIRNILEFEQDFPEAKIIRLEQNYRSTQNILQAASAVVANNVRRKGKNLWTSRQGGTKIGYYEAPDGENEALFAADWIATLSCAKRANDGETPRAAVLYRTNSQSRLFEEAMRRYGLKYHVVGGFSFYERSEIKDMISYLKVIHNPDDSISLLRVINTPTRGIGKGTIDTLEQLALETGLSLWGAVGEAIRRQLLPPRALASLQSFQQLIEDARAMLAGTFAEQLDGDVARAPSRADAGSRYRISEASAGRSCHESRRRRHGFRSERIRKFLVRLRGCGCGDPTPETACTSGIRRQAVAPPRQPAGRRRRRWRKPRRRRSDCDARFLSRTHGQHRRHSEVPDRPHGLHQTARRRGHAGGLLSN